MVGTRAYASTKMVAEARRFKSLYPCNFRLCLVVEAYWMCPMSLHRRNVFHARLADMAENFRLTDMAEDRRRHPQG